VQSGGNAAVADSPTSGRTSIDIFSCAGAPVIAVNDGMIQAVGSDAKRGRSLSYGQITRGRQIAAMVPGDPDLSPATRWHVAGSAVAKVDGHEFVSGAQDSFAGGCAGPGRLPDDDGHQRARNPGRRSNIFERRRLAGRDRRRVSSVHRHPSRVVRNRIEGRSYGSAADVTRAIYTVMGFGRLLVTTSRTGRGRTDDAWLVRNRSRQTSGRLCRAALPQ